MPAQCVSFAARLLQFEGHLREADRSDATIRNYASDLRQFARWAESVYGHPPDIVQALDVQAWRQYMQAEQRQSSASVNRRLAALKAYCAWQTLAGLSPTDEAAAVHYVKVSGEPAAAHVLSHAEMLRVLKAVKRDTWQGKRDYAILHLFIQCGLRLSELCDVRLVDFEAGERSGWLRVPVGKGRKQGAVPVNKTARDAVAEYMEVQPESADDHLFLSQKLRGISPRAVESLVQKHFRAAGIDVRVHDLRHLFATNVYESSGHDILVVQRLLRHANLRTTMRYTHRSADDLAQAAESSRANLMGEPNRKGYRCERKDYATCAECTGCRASDAR